MPEREQNGQYATADRLNRRISMHEKYSVNRQGFHPWIFSHYALRPGDRILELGCGTGETWEQAADKVPQGCRLVLTDASPGMVDTARERLSRFPFISFQTADIQELPFPDGAFDAVIANMMLYHVPDIGKGLEEARRVLKTGGKFYCATYGEHGIMEYLSGLLGRFGVRDPMNRRFTLQNGEVMLKNCFSSVIRLDYPDALAVTEPEDLADYLYSLGSMMRLDPALRGEMVDALRREMKNGVLTVPKEYGMFICE